MKDTGGTLLTTEAKKAATRKNIGDCRKKNKTKNTPKLLFFPLEKLHFCFFTLYEQTLKCLQTITPTHQEAN